MNNKDLSKPVQWPNGCDKTAVGALEYLAENKRPAGGEETYNKGHLYMIAYELKVMASRKLYSQEYVQSLLERIEELEREKSYATFQPIAARDVLKERLRQVEKEGWTPEHDDQHENGEMAFAAASYAFHAAAAMWDLEDFGTAYGSHPAPKNWPWDNSWWKPVSPRRDLVRAGALILAEIDRLDRKEEGDQK